MAVYSANKPNRTLTLHKPGCSSIKPSQLKSCGCGATGNLGNQQWYCEEHITIKDVKDFMNGRFWSILLCDKCFGNE